MGTRRSTGSSWSAKQARERAEATKAKAPRTVEDEAARPWSLDDHAVDRFWERWVPTETRTVARGRLEALLGAANLVELEKGTQNAFWVIPKEAGASVGAMFADILLSVDRAGVVRTVHPPNATRNAADRQRAGRVMFGDETLARVAPLEALWLLTRGHDIYVFAEVPAGTSSAPLRMPTPDGEATIHAKAGKEWALIVHEVGADTDSTVSHIVEPVKP